MATYLNLLYATQVGTRTRAHESREQVLAQVAAQEAAEAAKMAALVDAKAKAAAMKAEQAAFDQAREDRELDYIAEGTVTFREKVGLYVHEEDVVDLREARKSAEKDRHAGGLKAAKIEAVTKMLTDQVRALAKANGLNDRERWEAAITLCRGLRGTHPRNILDRVPIGDVVKGSYK
jgi:hypothetical protein